MKIYHSEDILTGIFFRLEIHRIRIFVSAILCLATVFIVPLGASADVGIPKVTRWIESSGAVRPSHVSAAIDEPLLIKGVAGSYKRSADSSGNKKRVCLVVHEDVYDAISSELSIFRSDIRDQGYDVLTKVYVSGSPEDLRGYLAGLYQGAASLDGAVLIGNIPYIIYELMQNWGDADEYEDFPCDIFYMDLDGIWGDNLDEGLVRPDNGKYDSHTGDTSLEIWVSRIKTDNLNSQGSEADIICRYLEKDHKYRSGLLSSNSRALIYDDDDWQDLAEDDLANLQHIFNDEDIVVVSDPEDTTLSDYRDNQLNQDYQFITLRSHGSSRGHSFYRQNRTISEYIFSDDYLGYDPSALFYSLFVCSAADFTTHAYLAGSIAFNDNDSGLLVWGSTKTGGMWAEQSFYVSLNNGFTFGESFRRWFNMASSVYPGYAQQYWYGMALIGDGSLVKGVVEYAPAKPVADISPDDGVDELSAGFAASVTSGIAPLNVVFADRSTGGITSWTWDFGDGGSGNDRNPVHTYYNPGTYTVTLTIISHEASCTTTRTQYIDVAKNQDSAPVADAGDDAEVGEGAEVVLDGSDSFDADGDIVSYAWEQISGSPVELSGETEMQTSFYAPDVDKDGDVLVFSLSIIDAQGHESFSKVSVHVIDPSLTIEDVDDAADNSAGGSGSCFISASRGSVSIAYVLILVGVYVAAIIPRWMHFLNKALCKG